MAHIITSIVAIALIVMAAVTLSNASLSSASEISTSLESRISRTGETARTELSLVLADVVGSGTNIDITLRNSGQTAVKDFSLWDVVIEYYSASNNSGLNIKRLGYVSSGPSDEEWAVVGIYLDAAASEAEVYEPNIFNPGEVMKIRLNIDPEIPVTTDNLVTVAAENGTRLSAPFSR